MTSTSGRTPLSPIRASSSRVERDRFVDGFITDKTMTFSYFADGNVREIVEHHPFINGLQSDAMRIDDFESYDHAINVDGFSLLHSEFFDHLVLLSSVQLQKGNPARVTHTEGGVSTRLDYTYSYDVLNRPLTKSGAGTVLTRADSAQRFTTLFVFTYY